MTNRRNYHCRKSLDRRAWLLREPHADDRRAQLAMALSAAGLEQAQLEAEARADDERCAREDTAHYGDGFADGKDHPRA